MDSGSLRRLRGGVREAHAREVLARFAASGASRGDFCRKEGICTATLSRWMGEFGAAPRAPAGQGFVEVRLDRGSGASGFELELVGGRRLRIPPGFDVGDLGRLLSLLEPAAC